MKVVTAPEPVVGISEVSCFLAGGIQKCGEWQKYTINKLEPYKNGVLFNPRRANFPIHIPDAAKEQIVWEFIALREAKVFSMWFCAGESDQPICMFELGAHLAMRKASGELDRVIIGVERGYKREADVRIQTSLVAPSIEIHSSLDEHARKIAETMERIRNE